MSRAAAATKETTAIGVSPTLMTIAKEEGQSLNRNDGAIKIRGRLSYYAYVLPLRDDTTSKSCIQMMPLPIIRRLLTY